MFTSFNSRTPFGAAPCRSWRCCLRSYVCWSCWFWGPCSLVSSLWLLQSFCFLSPKGRDLIEQFNKIKKYPFIEFYLILLFICHLEASVIHNFYPSICMYIFCVSISYVKVCLITQVCTLMKALYSEVWNSSSSSLISWTDGRDFTPEIFIEETELTCHIFIIPLE